MKLRLVLACSAALLGYALLQAPLSAAAAHDTFRVPVTYPKLPNGLRVLFPAEANLKSFPQEHVRGCDAVNDRALRTRQSIADGETKGAVDPPGRRAVKVMIALPVAAP